MTTASFNDIIQSFNELIDSWGFLSILIISLVFLFLIWITGKLLKGLLQQIKWIHPDARNLLAWFITIGQLIAYIPIIVGILTFLGIPEELILSVIAIFVTAIAAASISIVSNFIGGLYIIITRPFRVGDLIRTQGTEGIVEEISLNYTKIVQIDQTRVTIPNSNLLYNSLLNYNIKLPKKTKEVEANKEIKLAGRSVLVPEIIPSTFQTILSSKEFVRYRAKIELRLDMFSPSIQIKTVIERLNQVCDEFTSYFSFRPTFYFGKYDFRQELNFIITAPDGYTIFNSWPFFIEAIMQSIYVDLQQEANG